MFVASVICNSYYVFTLKRMSQPIEALPLSQVSADPSTKTWRRRRSSTSSVCVCVYFVRVKERGTKFVLTSDSVLQGVEGRR